MLCLGHLLCKIVRADTSRLRALAGRGSGAFNILGVMPSSGNREGKVI